MSRKSHKYLCPDFLVRMWVGHRSAIILNLSFLNDNKFDDLQRLHYLKACLDGEASALVQNLDTTADNFSIAWSKLKTRYANPCLLISTHIMFLITSKLDKSTIKAWELSRKNKSEYPTFETLHAFLEHRVKSLDSLQSVRPDQKKIASNSRSKMITNLNANLRTFYIETKCDEESTSSARRCPICKAAHRVYGCPKFKQFSVLQRLEVVRKNKLCRNCLTFGHFCGQCRSTHGCRSCNQRHHSLLHVDNQVKLSNDTHNQSNTPTVCEKPTPIAGSSFVKTDFLEHPSNSHVVLATVWLLVSGDGVHQVKVRALLDQGSTHSLVSQQVVNVLKCGTHSVNASLSGIGDVNVSHVTEIAPLIFSPIHDSGTSFHSDALVVKSLKSYIPRFRHPISHWSHLEGLTLADEDPTSQIPIQVIIGADLYPYVLREGHRKGSLGQTVAQCTAFGWILSGGTGQFKNQDSYVVHSHFAGSIEDLDPILRKFWEVKDVPEKPRMSVEDEQCEQYFMKTVSRDANGRYIVRIPFIMFPLQIGETLSKADHMLCKLETRLARKPDDGRLYSEFLEDYMAQGHMTPFTKLSHTPLKCIYLPHHPVFKRTSTTTKLRVVFNAASRMHNGKSLNGLQFTGPKLQSDLPLLITRWRLHRYVYCADIEKMYRQILVHPDDRAYQCIRWRKDRTKPVESFQLNTIGTASAPYLAQRVIKQLVLDEGYRFPLAVPIVRDCLYVDDCLFGSHDIKSITYLRHEVVSLLDCGGFTLRKWASNHPSLLEAISPENHGLAINHTGQGDESIKVLGIRWDPLSDSYKASIVCEPMTQVTKRTVLSVIARMFDPLGWFSPVVVTAKIFMQTLWRLDLSWDSDLPESVHSEWIEFYSSLSSLNTISISRWMHTSNSFHSCELHGFADATMKASAAVVYLRCVAHDGSITVSLVSSKTRVSQLKELTIPRLELCAAVLLAKLIHGFKQVPEFSDIPVQCWSDSNIVLAWLNKPATTWKTFVSNRISIIQECLPQAKWCHVSGVENPADLASRGVAPSALSGCRYWFHGPAWLIKTADYWPVSLNHSVDETQLELRSVSLTTTVVSNHFAMFDRFSYWTRFLRVFAWIRRWLSLTRSSNVCSDYLRFDEITVVKSMIIKALQAVQFADEIACLTSSEPLPKRSSVLSLNPFLDAQGLLRVGGRLEHSNLSFANKHPLLLQGSHITRLIVRWAHERCLHGGISLTLSTVRSEFWIVQAERIVRSVIFHCVACARIKADLGCQLMGSLPSPRIQQPQRAFLHCAVHLELVSDYSTSTFLSAYHRFCSRRGLPSDMYSDCGTNFQGADRDLKQAFHSAMLHHEFQSLLARDAVSWHFIPPAAPHFDGIWEAGVKSMKGHLKRVLLGKTLTYEELTTLLSRIEACLNSRPLLPLSDHPDDLDVLSPAHFLIGAPLTAIPAPTLLDKSVSCISRWLTLQQTVELFWKRWSADYVLSLQHRTKWKHASPSMVIGQLVLIAAETLPPTRMRFGWISSCCNGENCDFDLCT